MTKVQLHYRLARPLDEELLGRIDALHGVYGMFRLTPGPDGLTVDYDATRLSEQDVERHLRRAGIPIQLSA
jgi:hypothetical protein